MLTLINAAKAQTMARSPFCQTVRRFSKMFEGVQFPYIFGQKAGVKDVIDDKGPTNIVSGIKLAYRALLVSIAEGGLNEIKEATENRLFKRFDKNHKDIVSEGYTFLLHNRDSDIKVVVKDMDFIIGGYIDRETEYSENLMLVRPNASTLLYTNLDPKNFSILAKVKANVFTSLKLDLKDSSGNTLIPPDELPKEEQHEVCIEGVVFSKAQTGLIRGMYRLVKAARKLELMINDVVFVDVDNVLKGNCHKDSATI